MRYIQICQSCPCIFYLNSTRYVTTKISQIEKSKIWTVQFCFQTDLLLRAFETKQSSISSILQVLLKVGSLLFKYGIQHGKMNWSPIVAANFDEWYSTRPILCIKHPLNHKRFWYTINDEYGILYSFKMENAWFSTENCFSWDTHGKALL